jgi:hypothetical protein
VPDRDGDHMYRIKTPLEEYERLVQEDLLVKSNGYARRDSNASVALQCRATVSRCNPRRRSASLYHLVGGHEEAGRHSEAEPASRLEGAAGIDASY